MTEEAKKNLVCMFKRNWSHIELTDEYDDLGEDLLRCLKKGLAQREGGRSLCILLPDFRNKVNAEMDMLDIVAIAKMGDRDAFAVIRGDEPDEEIFNNVSGSVTLRTDGTRVVAL